MLPQAQMEPCNDESSQNLFGCSTFLYQCTRESHLLLFMLRTQDQRLLYDGFFGMQTTEHTCQAIGVCLAGSGYAEKMVQLQPLCACMGPHNDQFAPIGCFLVWCHKPLFAFARAETAVRIVLWEARSSYATKHILLAACCFCKCSERLRTMPRAAAASDNSLQVYTELTEWSSNQHRTYRVAVSQSVYLKLLVTTASVPYSNNDLHWQQGVTTPHSEFPLHAVSCITVTSARLVEGFTTAQTFRH